MSVIVRFPNAVLALILRHPVKLIIALVLLAHLPMLIHGMPIDGDDTRIHLLWQRFYAGEIADGNLFPRWLHQLNNGFGSPAFFLYPPVAHLVSAMGLPLFPGEAGAA